MTSGWSIKLMFDIKGRCQEVGSRTGAVSLRWAYPLPSLSFDGASLASP